jgi:ABC-type transport system involved in multi-copper enzyme maturation permease subunit
MDEFDVFMPRSAADFAREIVATNMLPFFFLPLIITIFCADFGNGTYRNTLSYETNRTKVYLSKLILSVCGCVFLTLVSLLLSILIGGIAFGFGGLTPAFFLQILVSTLLLLPIQLAIIGFGHCLVAFTKKSSMTIAIYLIALMLLTSLIQMLTMIPSLQWLSLLDWNMVGKLMISYWTLPFSDILIAVVSGLAIAAGTTVLGVTHYRKADMA